MENGPFIDDFPSYIPPFISGILHGYVTNNQMVPPKKARITGQFLCRIPIGFPSYGDLMRPCFFPEPSKWKSSGAQHPIWVFFFLYAWKKHLNKSLSKNILVFQRITGTTKKIERYEYTTTTILVGYRVLLFVSFCNISFPGYVVPEWKNWEHLCLKSTKFNFL